ncbi:MAG: thiamine pyrophosphate-binding protein [Chloroflexi bacterium]|nr:thiamine pyrophosphate-binding protein [Chloroflexota bacterium]
MHGYAALADALVREGVKDVFTLAGSDVIELLQDLRDNKKVRVVSARHEAAAATMADAYARVTGGVGVCTATLGPGITNAATALVSAARNRSPLIFITSEVPRTITGTGTRCGAAEPDPKTGYWVPKWGFGLGQFAEATGVTCMNVRSKETLAEDTQAVFQHVRSGKGPVVFAILRSIMEEELGGEWHYTPSAARKPDRVRPDSEAIARAAGILRAAEKPVILAGRGAFESQAGEEIRDLARRTGALLANTTLAMGFFADHPNSIGIAGHLAYEPAQRLLRESDCLVAVGCSLSAHTTGFGILFPRAKTIRIDLDPARTAKVAPPSVGITGDARVTLAALNKQLDGQVTREKRGWNGDAASLAAAARAAHTTSHNAIPGTIDPGQLVMEIDRITPKERIVAVDGGIYMFYPVAEVRVPSPDRFVWSANDFASIGLGLFQGIGAALGRPDQHVIVIVGDGGLMASIQELDTAVRYRIPMTVFVFNDGAFGSMVHLLEDKKGKNGDVVRFDNPEFADVARAFGAVGMTVRSKEDLQAVSRMMGKGDRPLLVDAKIDPTVVHETWKQAVAQRLGQQV